MTTPNERRRRIRQLQEKLRAAGLYAGPVDGIAGPLTREALKRAVPPSEPRSGPAPDSEFSTSKGVTMLTFLTGYRTYIVAAMMLLTGLAGVLGMDVPSFSGQAPGSMVLQALAFFFLRQGLKMK